MNGAYNTKLPIWISMVGTGEAWLYQWSQEMNQLPIVRRGDGSWMYSRTSLDCKYIIGCIIFPLIGNRTKHFDISESEILKCGLPIAYYKASE